MTRSVGKKETYGISKVIHEMNWSLRCIESRRIITVYSHTSASNEAAEPEVRLLRIEEHSGQVLLQVLRCLGYYEERWVHGKNSVEKGKVEALRFILNLSWGGIDAGLEALWLHVFLAF